jgi:hypothetical protein
MSGNELFRSEHGRKDYLFGKWTNKLRGNLVKTNLPQQAVTPFQNLFLRKDPKRRRMLKIMAYSRLNLTVKDIN